RSATVTVDAKALQIVSAFGLRKMKVRNASSDPESSVHWQRQSSRSPPAATHSSTVCAARTVGTPAPIVPSSNAAPKAPKRLVIFITVLPAKQKFAHELL